MSQHVAATETGVGATTLLALDVPATRMELPLCNSCCLYRSRRVPATWETTAMGMQSLSSFADVTILFRMYPVSGRVDM